MARPTGSKMIKCPKPKCKGQIIAMVGEKGTCKTCGTSVKFTKKLLKDLNKL